MPMSNSGSGILRLPTPHESLASGSDHHNSPRQSVRSFSANKRHWLMKEDDDDGDLPVSSVGGSASVSKLGMRRDSNSSHPDLTTCMRDLKALESATFERLTELDKTMKAYIDEAASRLQGQLSRTVIQQTDAERTERTVAVAEMRAEFSEQREQHSQAVSVLRREVGTLQSDIAELVRLRHQATPSGPPPQDRSPAFMSQVTDLENTLSHLRTAHQTQHDHHKRQVEDVQRGLKAELSRELESLRSEALCRHSLFEEHVEKMRIAEETSRAHATRMDEMRRMIVDFQQDALSETTVLRRRVEAVAGESDEQAQHIPTLRRIVEKEQSQRALEGKALAEQVHTLEKRLAEIALAKGRPHEAEPSPALHERLRHVEASVREAMTGARSVEMMKKSHEQAVTDVQRQMAKLETVLADLRSEQKALRYLQEADRAANLQKMASKAAMQADMHAGMDGLDINLRKDASTLEAYAVKMQSIEDVSHALTSRLDETRRMVVEFQQDSLTETKLLRGRVEAFVSTRDDFIAQRSEVIEVRKILDEDRSSRALERRSFLERLQLLEQQVISGAADRHTPAPVNTSSAIGYSGSAPASTEVTVLLERVTAAEANAHRAPLVAAQNLEVTRNLVESEKRMLLERIEPLEQKLPSAGALEAMAQRLLRVEQQCSSKNVGAAAADAAGGSEIIPRLEALETACQALQILHDKTAKNNLGMSLEAASTQQDFSQLRSSMELLQVGLVEERAERMKALQEAKHRVDECFEAVDCRLAGIMNCRVSDTQSEPSESRAIDRGYARRVGELDAQLRAEMANRVRTLTMELRGEILGEVAVRVGSTEARIEILETRLTGDLKRNSLDLGMRIDHLEDKVNGNSKQVAELEERTVAVGAIEAIEKDTRAALQEEDASKRGGKRSCSPKLALMRSTHSNGGINKQHSTPAPVDSGAADPRSSERSNSTTDVDGRGSVRLASPEASNSSSYRSLSALQQTWQTPMAPTGESSNGDEDFASIPDGISPLSDGLKQSLQGLVSAVHRTFPKKDGPARILKASSARIPVENEIVPTLEIVHQRVRPPTDASSKSHSPGPQKGRTSQELPVVSNQVDSEPVSSESAVRFGLRVPGTKSTGTPSIVSQMLANQRNSRQTIHPAMSSAARPRISTMEVEPTHTGRTSPKLASNRSSPNRRLNSPPKQSLTRQNNKATALVPEIAATSNNHLCFKASLVERAQELGTSWPGKMVNGLMSAAAPTVRQPDGVTYQPAQTAQPRLSLSRYLV